MQSRTRSAKPRRQRTPNGWTFAASLAALALCATDIAFGAPQNLSGTFGVVPFIAAIGARPFAVAVIGSSSVALSTALALSDGVEPSVAWVRVGMVVGSTAAASFAASRRQLRERRLRAMIKVADVAQRALLPPLPKTTNGYALNAVYVSATEDARVGGDLYDLVEHGGSSYLMVADVRGKGLDAVRVAAAVMRAFREATFTASTLADIPAHMEKILEGVLVQEDFVTCVIAMMTAGRIALVNCGHPSPLIVDGDRIMPVDPPQTSPPLGIGVGAQATSVTLTEGQRLLLYTDGLIETKTPTGGFADPAKIIRNADSSSAASWTEAVLASLLREAGGFLADDLALVAIEPAAPGPDRRSTTSRRGA